VRLTTHSFAISKRCHALHSTRASAIFPCGSSDFNLENSAAFYFIGDSINQIAASIDARSSRPSEYEILPAAEPKRDGAS